MITLMNVCKNFDTRILLDDVTMSIFANERIGLTGPNGAGKSTLFSIIRGALEPSSGQVQMQKNIKLGYLPQEARFDSKRTVMEEVASGDREMQKLIDEKRKLEDEGKAGEMRYGDILEELEALGIYDLEHKAEKILVGLGFEEEDFQKPITHLSGGWQMRALLAKLLTYDYNVLLLDEPTNYLDLSATLWLKDFLASYPGTFIMISHDKEFLNDVTNYTIVLEDGKLAKIKGNYAFYEQSKETEARTIEKQQKVIEKRKQQLERFAQRFHAQPNRASAVKNKRRMIEKLENQTVAVPQEKLSVRDFKFPPTTESGYNVITLDNVKKQYPDKLVYENLSLEITKGQRVCLVGPNGAGKSTLLKILAGVLPFEAGTLKLGHQVKSGYFSQTRLDVLSPNRSALDELMTVAPKNVQAAQGRNLLALFNFRGDDVFKKVSVLSGGEKSRLILAKLIINPPNFMLLDEPTTHLDVDGVEALIKALKTYQGTLCFISHDLFFIREMANHLIEVDRGSVKHYYGGLQYYLDKKAGIDPSTGSVQKEKPKAQKKSKAKQNEERQNAKLDQAAKKHREALKRLKQIKAELGKLDKEEEELNLESYSKSRVLSDKTKIRDKEVMKAFGARVKDIQTRLREIATERHALEEERDEINLR